MDFLFDKATSPLKITAPEEAPLWPTVFDYFGYRTEDALNRACNSLDMLRLPDHWWPADLVSGHRSRLFRTKQAQIEEVRGVCDRIAGENFKDAFGQREQDQNCLAFILAIFTDTQKQLSFAFTRLLNPRSIAYHRLKERMALVDSFLSNTLRCEDHLHTMTKLACVSLGYALGKYGQELSEAPDD